jgi:hypothetical protein
MPNLQISQTTLEETTSPEFLRSMHFALHEMRENFPDHPDKDFVEFLSLCLASGDDAVASDENFAEFLSANAETLASTVKRIRETPCSQCKGCAESKTR